VAVAALIFAAVAWGRLSDAGRGLFLLGATCVAAGGAAVARERLSATAQALSGLTTVLVLVDWYVFRRAGVAAGWSDTAWWAVGTGLAAAGAGLVARWFPVQRVMVAVLSQVCAGLVVAEVANGEGAVGLSLAVAAAMAAAIAAVLWNSREWRLASGVLATGSALMLTGAGIAALALLPADDLASAVPPVAILAAMGLAPAVARANLGRTVPMPLLPDGLVGGAAAALILAGTVLAETVWHEQSVFGPVAVLGLLAVSAGRVSPAAVQRGTQFAGAATLALATIGVRDLVAQAVASPLSSVREPWTAALTADALGNLGAPPNPPVGAFGAALVVLLALGAASVVCIVPARAAYPASRTRSGDCRVRRNGCCRRAPAGRRLAPGGGVGHCRVGCRRGPRRRRVQ
jgi:hypothetical protein